jgi:hypothetical protein
LEAESFDATDNAVNWAALGATT